MLIHDSALNMPSDCERLPPTLRSGGQVGAMSKMAMKATARCATSSSACGGFLAMTG